jgi:hypothetical protein
VAPVHADKPGSACATYEVSLPTGPHKAELKAGELRQVPLEAGATAEIVIQPARGVDAGAGPGQELKALVHGGLAGLIIDGRGRPVQFASDSRARADQIGAWTQALGLYGD